MKKFGIILLALLAALIILAAIVMIKTATYPFGGDQAGNDVRVVSAADMLPSELSLRRFSGGIRIPTISTENYETTDFTPFDRFKEYLEESYPRIYENMEHYTVNDYGLVFHWRGTNSDLKPILFLSHYDVVPVVGYDPAESLGELIFRPDDQPLPPVETVQNEWKYLPFSGAVADGRIYGRGSLDMKCMLFSLLEAADKLLEQGFVPRQDIYFAFGQDEENNGTQGGLQIARHFQELGLRFDGVYDEGSIVADADFGFIDRPLALIGLGEKGFLTLRIRVNGTGGHSSTPPAKGSLVYAAEIIEKLNSNQMPARIIEPIESFLTVAGKEMGFAQRMVIANRWLFGKMLLRSLQKSPASNALIRTTTAITMARSSDAPNVLSSVSEITVNFRILPGDTVDDVIRHVEDICSGYDTEIVVSAAREPSNISSDQDEGYEILVRTIEKVYPEALISSYVILAGTDSYKYQIVSDNVYRFMPMLLSAAEQGGIHNENEYISIANFGRMIEFFQLMMQNFGTGN